LRISVAAGLRCGPPSIFISRSQICVNSNWVAQVALNHNWQYETTNSV
jgi:hypothetical protein